MVKDDVRISRLGWSSVAFIIVQALLPNFTDFTKLTTVGPKAAMSPFVVTEKLNAKAHDDFLYPVGWQQ